MLKDLQLAMAAAEESGADTTMGSMATKLYQAMNDGGYGGDDFSSIINRLAELNG